MKCQRCPKQASLHITEVLGENRVEELHFCEECAKKYLYEPTPAKKSATTTPPPTAKAKPSESTEELGSKTCEACGLKFVEFRNSGRLGCPHDYDSFLAELLPLLESIHGDVRHMGKTPRRQPRQKSTQKALAGLRKQLAQAVTEENYEEAAQLRDQIRTLEGD
jgi:protein arginine kinase activator